MPLRALARVNLAAIERNVTRLGTINSEIVCGISGRVPRRFHRDGEPLA